MKRFQNRLLGVDQGEVVVFSDFEDGGPMWTGEGPRLARAAVEFSQPFVEPPSVQVSLSMWDMETGANPRADIAAEDITTSGFHVAFRTWGDTRVARVRVSWTALGALPDDDAWDVH